MSCFLTVAAILLVVIAIVLIYAGVLKWFTIDAIETTKLPFGSVQVVYRPHVGEYKNCWVAFQEVKILLAATGRTASRTFGVYYDDPKEGKERCRYIVGAILAEGDEIEKQDLGRTEAIAHFKNNGFNLMILPKIERAVYTTFPCRAGLLSIWLAVVIVYKAMNKAISKVVKKDADGKDRGIVELCDGNIIHYVYHLDEPADKLLAPEFKSKNN